MIEDALEELGHDARSLTLSGLDGSQHPEKVSLETHVEDVVRYLESNRMIDSILVGHSYSGFVVGTVAARSPNLVSYSIFVEAFLPTNGRSLLETTGLDVEEEKNLIRSNDGKWPHPTREELNEQSSLSQKQIDCLLENFRDHPGRTITDRIDIPDSRVKGAFIGGSAPELPDKSRPRYDLSFQALKKGHWPMVTAVEELAGIMNNLIKTEARPDGPANENQPVH